MIEKMRFVSLSGPLSKLDDAVSEYLSRYDIHLENALSEFQSNASLMPVIDANPYQKPLALIESIARKLPHDTPSEDMTTEAALDLAVQAEKALAYSNNIVDPLAKEVSELKKHLDALLPYAGLNVPLGSIFDMKYVKYRFGRIGTEYFRKFENVINEESNAIFLTSSQTDDFVYGVYFVPLSEQERLDAQLYSLHFERYHIPAEDAGAPSEICQSMNERIAELEKQLKDFEEKSSEQLKEKASAIMSAKNRLSLMQRCFDVRKSAACTKDGAFTSFIICGWMPVDQATKLANEIEAAPEFRIVVEDEKGARSKPPTRFHNLKLFKPFEMYTEMYGLPAYNEFDPTLFIGITYSFIFGWMFGDVGQGLCLTILGFLLYRFKSMKLAGIISCAGVFSTFFGFMFGSIFGFEDIIPAYWLRAQQAMSQLPFVGNLNTVFAVAVVFGMGMILITMILNIINSLRVKDYENGLFSQNGIAGLIFYGTLVFTIIMFMTGHKLFAGIILAILMIVPVICMALKEPLTGLLTKHKHKSETGVGMFIAQAFFELFEIMLSFFSNTLSFVRIGAFAVSHAAMMEVVLMLAGAESGSPNIVVVILGNIFVMGMEGLVVGIQVLRLEYYEFFSRFYRGTGRPFVSFKDSL